MEQALDALRAMGLKLAVFSNKPDEFAGKVCEELFGNRFDLVAGNRPGIPVKPDPTGLFAAVERLGVRPEECLYCGDSWVDVDTGKNAGMPVIGSRVGISEEEKSWRSEEQIFCFNRPSQLPQLVAQLMKEQA